MKKIALVLVLALGGCTQLQTYTSQLAIDAGVASAAIPPACSGLSAVLTAVASLPTISATAQAKIAANNAILQRYCSVAQSDVVTAESIVAAAIAAVQAIQAANGQL